MKNGTKFVTSDDVLDRLCLKGRILENPVVQGTKVLRKVMELIYLLDFLGRRTAWMLGRTPPEAMVT